MTTRHESELEDEQPLISHLLELRDRLLRIVLVVLLIFVALAYFSNDLYRLLSQPLLVHLPQGGSMIATEVASSFFVPIKLAMVLAVFLAMPYILHQVWSFIAPGLYLHEKRLLLPLLIASIILFYAGVAFAYFVLFPIIFAFFTKTAPEGVAVMTDISHYLDFVLTIFFAFGAAFEVPIATILLVWAGVVTPQSLAAKRPYVVVGVFIIGAVLTPPDVFSQTMLAIPMWLLFEAGLFFSRYFVKAKKQSSEVEDMEAVLDGYEQEESVLRNKDSSE
jgi:sec-independent protein translocase protein TatC